MIGIIGAMDVELDMLKSALTVIPSVSPVIQKSVGRLLTSSPTSPQRQQTSAIHGGAMISAALAQEQGTMNYRHVGRS